MRGTGIYLYEMRFGEMMVDDYDDVMRCVGVKFCEGKGGMCPCWEVCVRIGVMS